MMDADNLMIDELPQEIDLSALLDLQFSHSVEPFVEEHLLDPLRDLLGRPSKAFRGELTTLGFLLVNDGKQTNDAATLRQLESLARIVELLHAGSLTVDDIQDASLTRRGAPALHLLYGTAKALNAGNWLYFWPFEIIRRLEIRDSVRLKIYEETHRTLLRAHFGQAVDVGVAIDSVNRNQVAPLSLASVELKSGALMSLPLVLGGLIANESDLRLESMRRFGHGFGIALQMFNDLGNIFGTLEPEKRLEDLRNRRPSWLWAFLSQELPEQEYSFFQSLVRELPENKNLAAWIGENDFIGRARVHAHRHLSEIFQELERVFTLAPHRQIITELRAIGDKIAGSYD